MTDFKAELEACLRDLGPALAGHKPSIIVEAMIRAMANLTGAAKGQQEDAAKACAEVSFAMVRLNAKNWDELCVAKGRLLARAAAPSTTRSSLAVALTELLLVGIKDAEELN